MGTYRIEPVTRATRDMWLALNRLREDLSPNSRPFEFSSLCTLAASPEHHRLFVAEHHELAAGNTTGVVNVVGMGRLHIDHGIAASKGVLEDLVVDPAHHRQGLGSRLLEAIIAAAKAEELQYIDLTSKYSREAARALYERCGWQNRSDSGIMRLELGG